MNFDGKWSSLLQKFRKYRRRLKIKTLNNIENERQREHFNSIAQRYHDARLHPNHLRLKELIWRKTFESFDDYKNRPIVVLEAMCGFGEGRKILQQLSCNIEYYGFDYSEEVVSLINKEEPSLHIHQADATTIELEENQYDIIILIGGLHHVPRTASDVIRRLVVGLKPGGYFINLEPTHGNFLFRIVREFNIAGTVYSMKRLNRRFRSMS